MLPRLWDNWEQGFWTLEKSYLFKYQIQIIFFWIPYAVFALRLDFCVFRPLLRPAVVKIPPFLLTIIS